MKVSIIIPVYNVERYLRLCLESVLSQTYKNIEVILVNDGSTDKSSDICRVFSNLDKRIILLDKENGGLSSARNAGIEVGTGELIYLLDSDDYIRVNAIEELVNEIEINGSDIAVAMYRFVQEDVEDKIWKIPESCRFRVTDRSCLYTQMISNHAWGKLYRRELFDGIEYPNGRNYEDVATTFKLFERAACISVSKDELYFYRQRKGAISQTFSEKNISDFLYAYTVIKEYYGRKPCEEYEDINYYMLTVLYSACSRLARVSWKDSALYKKDMKYIRNQFNSHMKSVKLRHYTECPMTWKLVLYKYHIAPLLLKLWRWMSHD